MQVYAEYAFAENFCMDFVLLFCAKAVTKNPCRYKRLALAAALGACFAIVYPLFGLNGWWGIPVKIIAGAGICALGGKYSKLSGFIKFTAVFTVATFVLGGALIALFSLTGAEYSQGSGYILSSVPVGIPLFFALVLAIAVKKIAAKLTKIYARVNCVCTVYKDNKTAVVAAFFDSGNKVYYGGGPVSILPAEAAEKLIDCKGIKTFVDIHTVAGKGKIAVFTADKVEIDDGKRKRELKNVLFGVSPRRIKKAVMHADLAEVN